MEKNIKIDSNEKYILRNAAEMLRTELRRLKVVDNRGDVWKTITHETH